MPLKVDPAARLERERARIRKREITLELAALAALVSLTVLPFLLGRFLPPLPAFAISMGAMAVSIAVAVWAVVDRRRAVRDL